MADVAYTTKAGDMLDLVCFDHYGYSSGAVEQVLAYVKNYRLSDQLEELPAGVTIYLPQLDAPKDASLPRIWDEINA